MILSTAKQLKPQILLCTVSRSVWLYGVTTTDRHSGTDYWAVFCYIIGTILSASHLRFSETSQEVVFKGNDLSGEEVVGRKTEGQVDEEGQDDHNGAVGHGAGHRGVVRVADRPETDVGRDVECWISAWEKIVDFMFQIRQALLIWCSQRKRKTRQKTHEGMAP